jgi:hypothetical protein
MTRRFLAALPALAFLTLLLVGSPADAALRAWLDNTQVGPGDTVELTLTHDGQTSSQPDLAPLKQDFDIVGRNTSTRLQIGNGTASATTELQLTLAPKHAGVLTIPSLSWDAERSAPLTLTVGTASGGGNGTAQGPADNRILLETEFDPKTPYVQGAVHVTVHVYAAVPLSQADLDFPATDAALVRQVGSDETGAGERNGQSYQVVTRHYLLFPQRSGQQSIPGPVLSGAIPARMRTLRGDPNDPFSRFFSGSPFAGMMGATKPIRLNGNPIALDVRPRPTGAGASYWLPARNLTLSAQWNPTDLQAHVGDPVTVNLRLQATDLTAAQLPDLSTLLTLPPGLKAYPDEPKLKDSAQGHDIVAERDQNIALIADQPGNFTIPELRLSWWDTQSNQTREVVIPARTLVVQPAAGSKSPTPTGAPDTQSATAGAPDGQSATAGTATSTAPPSALGTPAPAAGTNGPIASSGTNTLAQGAATYWPWVSLGLGLLWIATLIGWLRSRRRATAVAPNPPGAGQPSASDKSGARAAFHAACRANDAGAARRNLLIWANAALPAPRVVGLGDLAKRMNDPQLATLLRALDRGCYAGDSWDGAALAAALPKLVVNEQGNESKPRELAPLYR